MSNSNLIDWHLQNLGVRPYLGLLNEALYFAVFVCDHDAILGWIVNLQEQFASEKTTPLQQRGHCYDSLHL